MAQMRYEWIPHRQDYRLYNPEYPAWTVAYADTLEEIREGAAEHGYDLIEEFAGTYIALKPWARKDISRPFGARNLYYVAKETEKAVLVAPVDTDYKMESVSFWASKKAITDCFGNGSMKFSFLG